MGPLRILLTNRLLSTRTGTEMYVRDLAVGLLRRGHTPIVYSPRLGAVADDLRKATVLVVDRLRDVGLAPDLIHGHHHAETVTALLHFPAVPAVFCCHDRLSPWDAPPRLERVRRYAAVDDTCRDRLLLEHAIPVDRVAVLRNAVDLDRFAPRPPLPPRPRRALVFSHYAGENSFLPAVREACRRAGLTLDVVGRGVGNVRAKPEEVLGDYDLVFAKGRCALEALAVGTAVILCDQKGVGGLVTAADWERLRGCNLGLRTLQRPPRADVLLGEIARYDADDAAAVSRRVRAEAGLDRLIDAALALYEEVLREHRERPPTDPLAESRDAAEYLRRLTSIEELTAAEERAAQAAAQRDQLHAAAAGLQEQLAELRRRTADLRQQTADLHKKLAEAAAEHRELRENPAAWIGWRAWLRSVPLPGRRRPPAA